MPLTSPSASLNAVPSAIAVSCVDAKKDQGANDPWMMGFDLSAVWWSSIWRSPFASRLRDIPLCFARAWYIYSIILLAEAWVVFWWWKTYVIQETNPRRDIDDL